MKPQERADHLRIFRRELEELLQAGVLELTPEQRARIDAHLDQDLKALAARYDVDTSESQKQISWGMRIASVLGALALCTAVVLFFRRWIGYWPAALQIALLGGTPLALLWTAKLAARRETTLYYTGLISLVALAAFIANLTILGTIFNLTPTPNALAVWGGFALLIAYGFGLRLMLAAGLALLLGWTIGAIHSWRGWWWPELYRRPEDFLAAGVAVFLAPGLIKRGPADFPQVFRLVGTLAAFLAILILSFSGNNSYLRWDHKIIEQFYQLFGLALAASAVWLGIRQGWSEVVNASTAAFIIFLYIRLVDWLWDWMPKYLFFLAVGLVAVALVAVFKRLRVRMRSAV